MKTRTEEVAAPTTFEPFELVITVETKEDLIDLWHLFDTKISPNKKGDLDVWLELERQRIEQGVDKGENGNE